MPIASSTCVVGASSTQCLYYGVATSTEPVYSGTITAGDELIALFSFIFLICWLAKGVIQSL